MIFKPTKGICVAGCSYYREFAGFSDLTGSDQMLPSLTTVRTPRAEIGVQAAKMLLNLIKAGQHQPRMVDLGFEVVERDSS